MDIAAVNGKLIVEGEMFFDDENMATAGGRPLLYTGIFALGMRHGDVRLDGCLRFKAQNYPHHGCMQCQHATFKFRLTSNATLRPTPNCVWDSQDLLGVPEADDLFGARARSASDAGVLRRKGHLKEQDQMIEFMLRMHETHTSLEVMQKMEKWITEHQKVRTCVQPDEGQAIQVHMILH